VRVAALPSYGGVLSYIIHHAFSAEPLARRGKARWGKEESAPEVSADHPARHLPGANLGSIATILAVVPRSGAERPHIPIIHRKLSLNNSDLFIE
jgi:hypothetical protein